MPTYEYQCDACDNEFEIAESIDAHEDADPTCPACGNDEVHRAFGASVQTSSKT